MNKQTTNVYQYLSFLQSYLIGDLNTFHDVCKKYEELENQEKLELSKQYLTGGITGSINSYPPTTQYPYGVSGSLTGPTGPGMYSSGISGYGPFDVRNIHKYFRSTIPHTHVLFSTIDIVGFLMGTDRPGIPGGTQTNFKLFLNGQLSSNENETIKVLVHVFRHGMTHGYFPRLDVGISYHSDNVGKDIFFKENGSLILNVNSLETIVLKRLSDIKEDDNQYPDLENQFQKFETDNESKSRGDIEILRLLIP